MIRHEYSYWLTIRSDSQEDLKRAQDWLTEHSVVPDYLVLSDTARNTATYDVGDRGTIEATSEIVNALEKLASEMPALHILLDADDEEDHCVHESHFWHNGTHLSDRKPSVDAEALSQKFASPERYQCKRVRATLGDLLHSFDPAAKNSATLTKILSNAMAKADALDTMEHSLAGDFFAVMAPANLSDEEFSALKGTDELPLTQVAVKRSFLDSFAKDCGYSSLPEFFSEYNTEGTRDLEYQAEQSNALAFTYTPGADEAFQFPEFVPSEGMYAFADFLSSMLQDAGHEEASKHLDCLFEI